MITFYNICKIFFKLSYLNIKKKLNIFKLMVIMIINMFFDNNNIRDAINLWKNNKRKAIKKYGYINKWDVSNVTNMHKLFKYNMFNENINNWNVSNVTDMSYMFYFAPSFNKDLNNWNVSNVINMANMFDNAISFNQKINNWNVSNVIHMQCMFYNATSFNDNIGIWNISNLTNTEKMFYNTSIPFYELNATSFFDKPYTYMIPLKRQKLFNTIFNWDRRKNFILFLTHYNFIILNTLKNKNSIIK